jgi:glycosidase
MKVRTKQPLMRQVSLFCTILCFMVMFATSVFAQDPPQYGTPFAGVPDPRDANIYQVHLRPYSAAGNFAGVTARLDAIKALGINVLYLMPHYPHGTDSRSSQSPYCIKDFKAVGSEYGTLTDLRTLVDGAHARGMAVILDFVVNQTSWDHAWITQHPDWYVRDGAGVIQPLNPFPDVAALNFGNASMRAALVDAMRYWIFAANVDGYRCDYANNAPLDFWTNTINNLRGITSHKLLMFAEGDRLENFQVGFDMNFGDKWYYDAIKPISNGTGVGQIQTTTNTEYTFANSTQQVVRYTANHDTETNEMPLNVFKSHNGVVANFLVSAYMRGVPFLTSGQETDWNTIIPWPYTSVDINWNNNPGAAADFTKVLNFRNSSVAIRRGTMTNYSNNDVCAFTKISGTEKVVVMVNMRNAGASFIIPSAMAGSYTDAYTGAAVTLTSGATQSLTNYQYRVLKSGSSCTPTAITPYMSVNGGAWTQTSSATLTAGGSVGFGPQPTTGGSWSWTGPNGFTSTLREFTLTNVQVTQSGTYVATHINAAGCASTQNFTLTVNPPPSNLPAPWQTADVGAVAAAGSASHSSGTFTVSGSGSDVFDLADEFRFVYQPFSGDVTVTVRIGSLTNTNAWAKAGVMIRESLTTGSSNAAMVLTPSNGFNFQYRNGTNAGSTAAGNAAGTIPNWVRITRAGNVLTGFSSTNGTSWTQIGTVTITLPSSAYVGFFATSHNDGTLTTATFTNVSVTGGGGSNLTVSPTSLSLGAGAASGTINVTSNVAWTVTDNQTWITTSVTSGSNNGSFTVSATANTGAARSGTVTVTGGGITQTINVLQAAATTTTYYTIRNRWTGAYLYDAGANVGYGSTVANNNYKWVKEPVDATYFWLRNHGTGEYMHIENQTGAVQCTAVDKTWWSSQWSQESVDATYVRFRNRWQTGSIIHIENQNGSAQYAGGQDGWYSAQWQLTSVAGRLAIDGESITNNGETFKEIDVFPVPAKGNTFHVVVMGIGENETASMFMHDLNGKVVMQTKIHRAETIDHNLPKGFYLMRVQLPRGGIAAKKIVIEE